MTAALLPGSRQPYFSCRRVGASFDVSGRRSCLLGHVIPRDDGERDGIFAGWEWDGRTLIISHDRYGVFPLYYHATPTSIAIAPSISTLIALGAPKKLDAAAMAVFLRLGFFLGDDTPFQSIRACRPGGVQWPLAFDTSWSPAIGSPLQMSREAAMDKYLRLFRQAIARRPPKGPAVMPLSGGRDSRHILFELLAQDRRPDYCMTHHHFPPRNNEDIRIARLVSRAVHVPHLTVGQPGSRVRAEILKNLATSFCTDEHAQIMTLARFLRGAAVRTIYDGIGGDVLSGGLFLTPERLKLFRNGELRAFGEGLMRRGQQQLEFILQKDGLQRFNLRLALDRTAEELQHHMKAPNPVGSFFFWNRTRREIALAPYQILDGHVLAPYLDHDVYDYLSTLPADLLLDHRFHTDTIGRGYPRHAQLPFDDYSGPEVNTGWFYRRLAGEVATHLLQVPRSRWLRTGRILRRLARCAVTGHHGSFYWGEPMMVVYIAQLERFMEND